MSIPGTFYGFNIGLSGLEASQVGQDVVGNNIANAGTPGYSMETASFVEGIPFTPPDESDQVHVGQLGGGVVAASITRSSDQYLNNEVNTAQSQESTQSALSTWLGQIGGSFDEPSTNGLNESIGSFFNNFTALESNAEDTGLRTAAIEGGVALAQTFNSVQSNLTTISQQITANIGQDMSTINSDASQIASLNVQIRQAQAQNTQPNSLLDQRDLLVNNIATLANVTTSSNPDGTIDVSIGSTQLVTGTESFTANLASLQSRSDLTQGDLSGLTSVQSALAGYQSNLDTLANQVITQVNTLQESGMGLNGTTGSGYPLFTGNSASTIAVNQAMVSDPSLLAAAQAVAPPATVPDPADGSNAAAIAALQNTSMSALSNQTFQQYYQATVTNAGAQGAAANTGVSNTQAALTLLTNQQQSVSGVNMDQQMTNMMQFQQAYQSAAEFIQTQNSMLDTLINTMMTVEP